MTSPRQGDYWTVVKNIDHATDWYVRDVILPSGNGPDLIGSEIELRLIKNGLPLTRDDGQILMSRLFELITSQSDANASLGREPFQSRNWITSINTIYGVFSWEPGQQLEFAGSPCRTSEELVEKNKWALGLVETVAKEMGYEVSFAGFDKDYAENVEFVPRTRGLAWVRYMGELTPISAAIVADVHYGANSFQLTGNSGGRRFHKVHDGMVLADVVNGIKFADSERLGRVAAYGQIYPNQFNVCEAWQAQSVEASARATMERVFKFEPPFWNPDPHNLLKYDVANFPNKRDNPDHPRSVASYVEAGKCTLQDLPIFMGFDYGPAAQRGKGFHELRRADPTNSFKNMQDMTELAMDMSFDSRDDVLMRYLHSASFMSQADIITLTRAPGHRSRSAALNWQVTDGYTVEQIVNHTFDYRSLERLTHPVANYDRKPRLATELMGTGGAALAAAAPTDERGDDTLTFAAAPATARQHRVGVESAVALNMAAAGDATGRPEVFNISVDAQSNDGVKVSWNYGKGIQRELTPS